VALWYSSQIQLHWRRIHLAKRLQQRQENVRCISRSYDGELQSRAEKWQTWVLLMPSSRSLVTSTWRSNSAWATRTSASAFIATHTICYKDTKYVDWLFIYQTIHSTNEKQYIFSNYRWCISTTGKLTTIRHMLNKLKKKHASLHYNAQPICTQLWLLLVQIFSQIMFSLTNKKLTLWSIMSTVST